MLTAARPCNRNPPLLCSCHRATVPPCRRAAVPPCHEARFCLAGSPMYAELKGELWSRLEKRLTEQEDPRILGGVISLTPTPTAGSNDSRNSTNDRSGTRSNASSRSTVKANDGVLPDDSNERRLPGRMDEEGFTRVPKIVAVLLSADHEHGPGALRVDNAVRLFKRRVDLIRSLDRENPL